MQNLIIKQIQADFREIIFGNPWYGLSLIESLKKVPFNVVLLKNSNQHSIYEITLHITFWINVVGERLKGNLVSENSVNDWDSKIGVSEIEWESLIADLERASELLIEQFNFVNENILNNKVPTTSYTYLQMISGIVHHCIYHCGQINLLCRVYEK